MPGLLAGVSIGVFSVPGGGFPVRGVGDVGLGHPGYRIRRPWAKRIADSEFLVQTGDTTTLASRVIGLFADPAGLQFARGWARNRALEFNWERMGEQTARACGAGPAQRQGPDRWGPGPGDED